MLPLGVGEVEPQAGRWAGGLSAGMMRAGGKRAEGGGKTGAGEAFSQLSLCKPKAHEGNLCLT